jgi:hypothetical protein
MFILYTRSISIVVFLASYAISQPTEFIKVDLTKTTDISKIYPGWIDFDERDISIMNLFKRLKEFQPISNQFITVYLN